MTMQHSTDGHPARRSRLKISGMKQPKNGGFMIPPSLQLHREYSGFQRSHVERKYVFHISLEHALTGFVDLLHLDHFNILREVMFTADGDHYVIGAHCLGELECHMTQTNDGHFLAQASPPVAQADGQLRDADRTGRIEGLPAGRMLTRYVVWYRPYRRARRTAGARPDY